MIPPPFFAPVFSRNPLGHITMHNTSPPISFPFSVASIRRRFLSSCPGSSLLPLHRQTLQPASHHPPRSNLMFSTLCFRAINYVQLLCCMLLNVYFLVSRFTLLLSYTFTSSLPSPCLSPPPFRAYHTAPCLHPTYPRHFPLLHQITHPPRDTSFFPLLSFNPNPQPHLLEWIFVSFLF